MSRAGGRSIDDMLRGYRLAISGSASYGLCEEPLWQCHRGRDGPLQGSVKPHGLHAHGRNPDRFADFGVEDDMGRRRPKLVAGVENPCRSDPIGPRPVLHKRRLVNMASDDDVGAVLAYPLLKISVPKGSTARPTRRRVERRRVVDPNPAQALPTSGISFELSHQSFAHYWSVPPRANREQRIVDEEAVSVRGDVQCADVFDPAGDLLAGVAP